MDKYVRICPNCGHEIEYKSYSAWHSANKKNHQSVEAVLTEKVSY